MTRNPLARALLVAGAVAIGLFLFRSSPREVTLVYGVEGQGARTLEVEIDRGAQPVRHAEFRLGADERQVSHRVKLRTGDYVVHAVVRQGDQAHRVERPITVSEGGTIVLPLGG